MAGGERWLLLPHSGQSTRHRLQMQHSKPWPSAPRAGPARASLRIRHSWDPPGCDPWPAGALPGLGDNEGLTLGCPSPSLFPSLTPSPQRTKGGRGGRTSAQKTPGFVQPLQVGGGDGVVVVSENPRMVWGWKRSLKLISVHPPHLQLSQVCSKPCPAWL